MGSLLLWFGEEKWANYRII
uniref:Uncharacterized protein n=1 Tax=Rhizophora mucronata TaxID=61149 RepID=A0A2P2N4Q3_RHIMU